jgi:hypothetical protein
MERGRARVRKKEIKRSRLTTRVARRVKLASLASYDNVKVTLSGIVIEEKVTFNNHFGDILF